MNWLSEKWDRVWWYFHGPVGNPQPHAAWKTQMTIQGFISLAVAIVILVAVGWIILWICRRFGMPADLYNVVEIVVWVIVAAACCYRLLGFAGIA